MTTAGTQLRAAIILAIQQSATAASVSGLSFAAWSSTSVPRVFSTEASGKAQRNRGRLPFIELTVEQGPLVWDTQGGGEMTTNVVMVANVGGANQDTAQQMAEGLITAALAAIRSEATNNYTAEGQQTIMPFKIGPLWHTLECRFSIVNQFDLGNFGQK